jgi:hypothetical protein
MKTNYKKTTIKIAASTKLERDQKRGKKTKDKNEEKKNK